MDRKEASRQIQEIRSDFNSYKKEAQNEIQNNQFQIKSLRASIATVDRKSTNAKSIIDNYKGQIKNYTDKITELRNELSRKSDNANSQIGWTREQVDKK